MSNNKEIISNVFGLLTDEFNSKAIIRNIAGEVFGYKPVMVNFSIKELVQQGLVEEIINENGDKMVRVINKTADETVVVEEKTSEVKEERVRRTLNISEEDAEGLDLLTLRTPPVKQNIVYPDGVTKEMYEEFKAKILENKDLIWDLVGNFNGAKAIAITMWNPDHENANEDGKVFYRWDEPETTWPLMKQLNKIVELYNAQEAEKGEVSGE